MIGLFITGALLALSLFLSIYKKNDLPIVLFLIICGPVVKLGSTVIDSNYLVILYLLVKLLLLKKRLSINKRIKSYAVLVAINFALYMLSTIIYSNIYGSTIVSIIGFLKILILLVLIFTIYNPKKIESGFSKFIKGSLILNFIASFIQMVTQEKFLNFFRMLYSTGDDSYAYISGSHCYSRTFGLFRNGTSFAVYSLFVIAYILTNKKLSKKSKILYLSLALMCGLMSATKTFVIGIPLILMVLGVISLYKKGFRKINKKTLLVIVIIIFSLPLIILLFNILIDFLQSKGIFIKFYLNFLSNPLDIFNTGYNNVSGDILLSATYEIINKHPIIGVGFNSIKGEFLGDSTYVLALHNGGYLSLLTIIVYFAKTLIYNIKLKETYSVLYLIIIITTGFGISNLFNTTIVIPFFLYYILKEESKNEES